MFSVRQTPLFPRNTTEGVKGTPSQRALGPGIYDSANTTDTPGSGALPNTLAAANEAYAARTGLDPHLRKFLLRGACGTSSNAYASPTALLYQSQESVAEPTAEPTATPDPDEEPVPECNPHPAPEPGPTPELSTPEATGTPIPTATPEPGVTEVRVDIVTFIPYEQIEADVVFNVGLSPSIRTDVVFQGDNRDPGLDSSGNIGSYRTLQSIIVREGPGGELVVTMTTDAGETFEIRDGETVSIGTASGNSLQACYEVMDDGTIVIHVSGDEDLPSYDAPGISYAAEIRLTPDGNGGYLVSINGKHDNFPAYEVFVSADGGERELIYVHDPREEGGVPTDLVTGLEGPGEDIDEDVRVTSDGQVIDETED